MKVELGLILISSLVVFSLGCTLFDQPSSAYCGDGNCDPGECEVTCPADCATSIGSDATGTTGDETGGTTTGNETSGETAAPAPVETPGDPNIQCQVGEHEPSWAPPEIYYNTYFMFNDGYLSILDDWANEPDFYMTVQPCGQHIYPMSPLGFEMMDHLNPNMFTLEGNFVYGVNDSGVTVVADNRANNTIDNTIIYHGRNTTVVVQRDGNALGNVSCGPASGTAVVDQINKSMNGTLVHPGNESVINVLRRKMGTTGNGTKLWDLASGLAEFLAQAGQGGKYRIKVFGNYTFPNGTAWNGGYIENGTQINWTSVPRVSWVKYFMEFYIDSEHVIFFLKRTSDGQQHAVTADNVRMTATKNYISFMDPWDGDIKEHEVDANSCMTLWNQQWCINHMISISPIE
jgi:hypothetical protein